MADICLLSTSSVTLIADIERNLPRPIRHRRQSRIPVNYPCRSHFSDVELRTVLTYRTSTFHAIAFKQFESRNSGLISYLHSIRSVLFISETGISHQRPDVCGSLTFMSLFYFLLHGRPTCYHKSTIARSWLWYRIASCTVLAFISHSLLQITIPLLRSE